MNNIEQLIHELPPDLQDEALDFIRFLLNKYQNKTKKKPEFLWEGALSDLRAQYTSVELQHEIYKLRIKEK
ncbi:MAG: DUF2281 domain-containing protein [Bacteroidota bacterium]|nr:DUF2281 domain-containing protein [Bacteroidota bacterium]